MIRPRLITRYALAELLTPTLLGLLVYTFVLLMNHFFYVAERALAKNLGFDLTARLFLTGLPSILILAIPMSVLLGSLIAMGRLSADHEWVALQGAGQGPWRLMKPLILHGLAASLAGFFVYAELAPRANYARRELQGEVVFSSNLAADLKPRVFYTEIPNVVLFVDEIDPGSGGRLDGVLLIRHDPRSGRYEVTLAREGALYPAPDRSGALIIELTHGVSHRYDPREPDVYGWDRSIEHYKDTFLPPDYLQSFLQPPEKVVTDLGFRDLLHEVSVARRDRDALLKRLAAENVPPESQAPERFLADSRLSTATVELQARIALPLASLCLSILALPLGVTRARSGKGAGFALSLLVILVYWATYTFFRDQAVVGKFPAALGPWMANLIILPWAAWSLWRMRRPRDPASGPLARLLRIGFRAVRAVRRALVRRRRARTADDTEGLTDVDPLENLAGTTNRFVFRIDQYVGTHFLRVLLLALLSAYTIYGLVELKGLTDGLLRTKQPPSLLLTYFEYFPFRALHIVLPISCLVAAVVACTLLARSGELTALKATGISVRRAVVPVLVVTAALCGLLWIVQDTIAPLAARRAQAIEDKIQGRAPKTYGMPLGGRWSFGPEGQRLYHWRLYDPARHEFQAMTVFTIDRAAMRIADHRYADSARWLGDAWELRGGWYRSFNPDGTVGTYRKFEGTRRAALDPPDRFADDDEGGLAARDGLADEMSLQELREEIAALAERGYDTTRLEVALHGKLARATAPLVMVLLGLPFAFRIGRRGSLYGIGVALVLVLVYWAVFAIFNAMGLETLIEPWAAAWAPNLFFGLLGSYLLLYVPT